jgi:hypothetical protein
LKSNTPKFSISEWQCDLYKIRMAMFTNGERMPLLAEAKTGLPLSGPNQYMLRERRATCRCSSMEKELQHIGVLYTWAHNAGIDIDDRLKSGEALSPFEVVSMVDTAQLVMRKPKDAKIVPIVPPAVSASTLASRLYVIRDYIVAGLNDTIARNSIGTLRYQHISEARDRIKASIESRIPSDDTGTREGLSPELRERLWDIVRPESPENPWHEGQRYRNQAAVVILSKLGPRKGDFLKTRVSGLSTSHLPMMHFPEERDSAEDGRRREPVPKTRERHIPLGQHLASIIDDYLLKERALIAGAKRTPYLVLSRSGKPLSLSGLREIIKQLVTRHPEFAGLLSSHTLRHTAADLWWALLQDSEFDVQARKEMLNYIMGWSATSNQGSKYPEGEIIRSAQAFALEGQAKLFERVASIGR